MPRATSKELESDPDYLEVADVALGDFGKAEAVAVDTAADHVTCCVVGAGAGGGFAFAGGDRLGRAVFCIEGGGGLRAVAAGLAGGVAVGVVSPQLTGAAGEDAVVGVVGVAGERGGGGGGLTCAALADAVAVAVVGEAADDFIAFVVAPAEHAP